MVILNVLGPVLILLGVGAGLARLRFLGPGFLHELNRLAFFVALPCLVFRSAVHAGVPRRDTLLLAGLVVSCTLAIAGLAALVARRLRMAEPSERTFVAAALFGNAAYIGIPVAAHSLGPHATGDSPRLLSGAVVLMTLLVVACNALSAAIFSASGSSPAGILRRVLRNPLVIAGGLGIALGSAGMALPEVLDRPLRSLGEVAVPAALLCIGGSLALTRLTGHWLPISAAVALKILALPILVLVVGLALGFPMDALRFPLIFAACPMATAVYNMASELGGDEALAAGAAAIGTLAAFVPLAIIIAIT
jgi:hypothetical protein